MHYLISADMSASDTFLSAVPKIGGKPFHSSYWLVYWNGPPDSLALKLRNIGCGRVVVCRVEDWSYR